jgi:4-amino-4-deoxy-L-arabinose transferase-like glycosyltransferase
MLVTIEALFSIPKLSIESVRPDLSWLSYLVGVLLVLASAVAMRFAARGFARVGTLITRIEPASWIVGTLVIGIVARLFWVTLFPAVPRSDSATYVGLAYKMFRVGEYSVAGTYAFWPPGYPLFLFGHFNLFGAHWWVPTVANFCLFAATLVVLWVLAQRIGGAIAARVATLLLALWPNYIFMTGLVSKENLVIFLLPLAVYLYLRSADSLREPLRIGAAAGAGLVLGAASLTQPAMLLLIVPIGLYELLELRNWRRSSIRLTCVGLGMIVVIAPWTMRNYRVFNRWVPISTNGGLVFYRANNPLATGGYIRHGEYNLELFAEAEWSPMGYKLGLDWIRNHPKDFLTLIWRKQALFLGDDASGAYETLRRERGDLNLAYVIFKALSQGYWLGLWFLCFAGAWLGRNSNRDQDRRLALMIMIVLCLFGIHSIFESGGRYHTPLIPIIAVLAALPFYDPREESRASANNELDDAIGAV